MLFLTVSDCFFPFLPDLRSQSTRLSRKLRMNKTVHKSFLILVLLCLTAPVLQAQLHCGNVELTPNTPVNALFSFDEFRDYQGGLILSNIATLRVNVENLTVPDPQCSWSLSVNIDNNPSGGTPANEWEELSPYGIGTGANPTIDILEVRIRNNCQTSPMDGVFQTFANHGDLLEFIQSALPVTPAGGCTTNVNGPGSYLSNPGEFTFNIDLRVQPGFQFDPGIYMITLRFNLEENP